MSLVQCISPSPQNSAWNQKRILNELAFAYVLKARFFTDKLDSWVLHSVHDQQ